MKLAKKIGYFLLSLFLLNLVVFALLSIYISSNKAEIIKDISEWYADNFYGEVEIKDVSVALFKNYPKISLILSDVRFSEDSVENHIPIELDDIELGFSFWKLIFGKFSIDKFVVRNSEVHFERSPEHPVVFLPFRLRDSLKKQPSKSRIKLDINNSNFLIENFHITSSDKILDKSMDIQINSLRLAPVKISDDSFHIATSLNAKVNNVGFNLKNGTFFNGAVLVGSLGANINFKTGVIHCPKFYLNVDQEKMNFLVTLFTKDNLFKINIADERANFARCRGYISQNIQKALNAIEVTETVDVKCQIDGRFVDNNNPLVQLVFVLDGNDVTLDKKIELTDVHAKGSFANRYTSYTIDSKESLKNVKIVVPNLEAKIGGVPLTLTNSQYFDNEVSKVNIKTQLNMETTPNKLNDLLKTKDFIFSQNGKLTLDVKIDGSGKPLNKLLRGISGKLMITNSSIYAKQVDISIPYKLLDLEFQKMNAQLKSLIIPLGGKSSDLKVVGQLNNISSLLEGTKQAKTSVSISSGSVYWDDVVNLLSSEKDKKKKTNKGDVYLNPIFNKIEETFHPDIRFRVNRFQFRNFIVNDLTTNINLDTKNLLSLKNTGFKYYNGQVTLNSDIDISRTDRSLFHINFNSSRLPIKQFLTDFDYFGITSLKNATNISGLVNVGMSFECSVSNAGLNYKSIDGTAFFNIESFNMSNFEPIIKIGNILFTKKRFQNINYRNISNTLRIHNGVIEIPKMEIQSSAFDLFVEGQLGYENNTDIWVSVPLDNLKKRDGELVPEFSGVNNLKDNIFIEAEDKEGAMKYKLRLSQKKKYEDKGQLEEFKEMKQERREKRKEERKHRREEKKHHNSEGS